MKVGCSCGRCVCVCLPVCLGMYVCVSIFNPLSLIVFWPDTTPHKNQNTFMACIVIAVAASTSPPPSTFTSPTSSSSIVLLALLFVLLYLHFCNLFSSLFMSFAKCKKQSRIFAACSAFFFILFSYFCLCFCTTLIMQPT